MLSRRTALKIALTAGATGTLSATAVDQNPKAIHVDTNISLFHWPFRRLPLDDTSALVARLKSLGIGQAWAGSFDSLLQRDMTAVNQRLADECRLHAELLPMGSVNLMLPDWEHDLHRCVHSHRMRGIRLFPGYHGYTLHDPAFERLLDLATLAGVFVQIVAALEDTRTQSRQLPIPDVDLTPLVKLMPAHPQARVQILNHRLRGPLLKQLGDAPGIHFDTARVEGTNGVPELVNSVPTGRVLYGSHAPFLIPEAAFIRVHESGQLADASLRSILSDAAIAMAGSETL
ncbi:MAG: amidohydrolase family protein [Planctomycetaceae bacterium]